MIRVLVFLSFLLALAEELKPDLIWLLPLAVLGGLTFALLGWLSLKYPRHR